MNVPLKEPEKTKRTGKRLYTDENPKDTVRIKYATVADAQATVAKVKELISRLLGKSKSSPSSNKEPKFKENRQTQIARRPKKTSEPN